MAVVCFQKAEAVVSQLWIEVEKLQISFKMMKLTVAVLYVSLKDGSNMLL